VDFRKTNFVLQNSPTMSKAADGSVGGGSVVGSKSQQIRRMRSKKNVPKIVQVPESVMLGRRIRKGGFKVLKLDST
jgi:hypothetical protein